MLREATMVFELARLFMINRLGRRPVVQMDGPVVSLTTYGKRSQKAYFSIESIARGEALPSRLILWVDEEALIRCPPHTIQRLQKRGLEIIICESYGSHKKYYPYVQTQDTFDVPLVTADDDIIYPRKWLKRLIAANRQHPDDINCYRAHVINIERNRIGRYADFKMCRTTQASFRNIAIGSMGVIYPPSQLFALKAAGTGFRNCCPKADDLWLHLHAIRSGHRIRQIFSKLPYLSFQEVPGTQSIALKYENIDCGNGNDLQIEATYKTTDIRILKTEEPENECALETICLTASR